MHTRIEHLELYALGELPDDQSGAIESHLKDCVPCGVQFEESREIIGQWAPTDADEYTGPEKRRSRRVETDDPAILTVLEPQQAGRINMRILDASKEGLKLVVPNELIRGAVVQIHVRDLFIMAEVRYCRPADAVFHVGVQIQDVFPAAG